MAKKRSKKPIRKKAPASKKAEAPKKVEKKSTSPSPSMNPTLRKVLTHGGLILGFMVLLFMYFSPLLSGETLRMGDIQQFAGMTQQVKDYRAETGEEAFWTSRMFGGMPTYHAGLQYPNNLVRKVYSLYFQLIPPPVSFIFLMFIGFYILLNTLKLGPLFSFLGSAAFAFSSYFFIIMEAGHTSKAAAIGFIAPTLAGVLMIYRGRWLTGAVLTAFSMALSLCANHVQITYYMGLMIVVLAVALLIEAVVENKFANFAKATGIALLAVVLGVAPNIGHLYTSYEYVQETIRGKAELSPEEGEEPSGGLDRGYAFDWSYEVAETFTLMVPNFMGGASQTSFDRGSKNYELIREKFGNRTANSPMPTFWGKPIFTSGPVYVGAIVCFLFVLGLILVKGPIKWGLLAATILFIMFSWGGNLMWFNGFIFDNLPLYNKFRAVSMALIIPEFTMPLLGLLSLYRLTKPKEFGLSQGDITRALYISGGVTGGLCLILALIGGSLFDFMGSVDQRYLQNQNGQAIVDVFVAIRKNMLQADAWRSFGLIAAAFAILWAYVNERLKSLPLVLALLSVLVIGDMWMVNKRYVNNEDFDKKDNYEKPDPTPATRQILQDNTYHRVLNLSVGSFNNSATTAFFHNDIGGYHPAKLRRYNDVILNLLLQEVNFLRQMASEQQGQPPVAVFQQTRTINMLNGKYIILGPQSFWRNPLAMGNAWFVQDYQGVPDANAEMEAMKDFDYRSKALVDQRFAKALEGYNFQKDSAASIRLINFSPNEISYQSSSRSDQLAIFSEVYYNSGKGWKAYVDGEEVPHIRANYVLRGLPLKAGNHEITFKMEPESYYLGETLSLLSSIVLFVFALLAALLAWRRSQQEASDEEA